MTYRDFINDLDLWHFTGRELEAVHNRSRNGVSNSLPPEDLWQNVVTPLRVADLVRVHFGRPITLYSAYRSPQYNAELPGAAPHSQHLRNCALDIAVTSVNPERVADYLTHLRGKGYFEGGIGRYRTFTHLDNRGRRADW